MGDALPFDTSEIHGLLDQADEAYHRLIDGHVPDEYHRFDAFLSTVRMVVDQSADRSRTGE
jgi:hypothetical protein